MKRNGQFWTEVEHHNIKLAQTFSELVPVALAVLERMPKPIAQVCGPISTGGLGSIEKNLAVFDTTIDHLMQQGVVVFDQMPFEEHIFRIVENKWGTRQNNMLLEEFYRPIFVSRHVSRLYFIHDWQSSEGANWEHALGQRLGIEIMYLERSLVLG
jgi:hypothetical protein